MLPKTPRHSSTEHFQRHGKKRVFPEANTCVLSLRLPLHPVHEDFSEYMISGIVQAPYSGASLREMCRVVLAHANCWDCISYVVGVITTGLYFF